MDSHPKSTADLVAYVFYFGNCHAYLCIKKDKRMKYGMMISGTIGQGYDWWSGTYGTRSKDVKSFLDAHADEEVNIAVSSPGGYVDEGLTIYQLIKDHGHVNIHIMGMTASIATVLCMGAQHVTMSDGSTMLIHNASTGVTVWESANKEKLDRLIEQWKKQRDDLDTIDKVIASVYASKSGKTSEDVLAQMQKESWMTPQQALDFGLIDEVRSLDDEDKQRQTNMVKRFTNSFCKDFGLPPLVSTADTTAPSKSFMTQVIDGVKEFFKNNNKINEMKKKFLNLQTILDRKDDFEVTDEKVTLTDAEMQKIEDAIAEKEKKITDTATSLTAAQDKVKDLEAQIADKDKSIQDKDQEIADLKKAPGAQTNDTVDDGAEDLDAGQLFYAVKQII